MNESFWLGVCFLIFILLFYKPIKKSILLFLNNKVFLIKQQIDSVYKAKEDMSNAFSKLKNDLDELVKNRDLKLLELHKNSKKIIESHNDHTDSLIINKQRDFDNYLKLLKQNHFQTIKSKLIILSCESVLQHFKDKNS